MTTLPSDTDVSDPLGDPVGRGDDAPGKHRTQKPSAVRSLVEWIVVIVGAVVIALVVKTFVVQAFYIPSESMLPTFEINDRVLVNKLSYRLHDVNRGDIIVFESNDAQVSNTKDLIKRVIGLPGDSLVIDGDTSTVYVNGTALSEPYVKRGEVTRNDGPIKCTTAAPCVVPANSVFVMGDNRGHSKDSRWIGYIHDEQIVGHAFVRVWPFSRFGGL